MFQLLFALCKLLLYILQLLPSLLCELIPQLFSVFFKLLQGIPQLLRFLLCSPQLRRCRVAACSQFRFLFASAPCDLWVQPILDHNQRTL